MDICCEGLFSLDLNSYKGNGISYIQVIGINFLMVVSHFGETFTVPTLSWRICLIVNFYLLYNVQEPMQFNFYM